MNDKGVFIIAEAGINHNGSLASAYQLVDLAKACAADAVKFQTFIAADVVTKIAPKAEYQHQSSTGKTQYEMICEFELSQDDFVKLKHYCEKVGILFLSTPFDLGSLDFLTSTIDVPVIKIGSGEITNAPLIYRAALTDKPIILSTGMCTLDEIQEALGVIACGYLHKYSKPTLEQFSQAYHSEQGQQILQKNVTLLHCTSAYPTPFNEVNLQALDTLRRTFGLRVGFSDHSLGIYASVAAVSHGVTVLEKHFTLDKTQVGPDHATSLSPDELKELVQAVRIVEQCQGAGNKTPSVSESKNIQICRRSLVVTRPIKQGETFSELNLGVKRPADGIAPKHYWEWLDTAADKDYEVDELLSKVVI